MEVLKDQHDNRRVEGGNRLKEAVLRAQSVSRSRRAPAPACKEARDGSVCEAAAVLNAVQAAVRAAERPTPLAEATVHTTMGTFP